MVKNDDAVVIDNDLLLEVLHEMKKRVDRILNGKKDTDLK